MRRVVVYPGRIAVEAADIPAPGPNEALVRTLVAGVCGSDLHAAHGRHPFVPLPYRPGHEVVGVIEAAGSAAGARRRASGSSWNPTCPAGPARCAPPAQNLCENLQFFGCGYAQGGMADYFTLAADRLHSVPDALDDQTAALIEPLSTPVHAVQLAGDVAGLSVAVFGAGTIGILMLALLRAPGARRLVVTDPYLAKRQRARGPRRRRHHRRARARRRQSRFALRWAKAPTSSWTASPSSPPSTSHRHRRQRRHRHDRRSAVRRRHRPAALVQDHQIRIQGSATYLPEDFAEIGLLPAGRRPAPQTSSRPRGRWRRSPRPSSSPRPATTSRCSSPWANAGRAGGPRFRRHAGADIAPA